MSNNSSSTNNIIKRYKTGALLSAVLSAAASAVYAAAYHFDYNTEMQHYKSGSTLLVCASILFILGILSALATAGLTGKYFSADGPLKPRGASSFFLYLTAFMFIGYFTASVVSPSNDFNTIFSKMCPIAGLLCAIPAFCRAFDKTRGGALHCYTSFIPIAWTAFIIFRYYFDMTHMPINSPEKNVTNVALALLILFFLSETRELIGRTNQILSIFSAISAAFVTGTITVARIVLFFTDEIPYPLFIENAMILSVSLYAMTKVFDIRANISQRPNKKTKKKENKSVSENENL